MINVIKKNSEIYIYLYIFIAHQDKWIITAIGDHTIVVVCHSWSGKHKICWTQFVINIATQQ